MPGQAPENKLTIRFRASGWLKLFVPVGVLAVASMVLNRAAWQQMQVWEYAVVCGLPVAVAGLWLLARRRYYLRLDPTGLTLHYVGRQRFYPWREIETIRVVRKTVMDLPAGQAIALRLREGSAYRGSMQRLARLATGDDVSILALYELDASALARVLEEWRLRYAR
jgi:hypothetical protein